MQKKFPCLIFLSAIMIPSKLKTLLGVLSLISVILLWSGSALVIKILTGEGDEPQIGGLLLTFYSQAHCVVLLAPLFWKGGGFIAFFRSISPMKV